MSDVTPPVPPAPEGDDAPATPSAAPAAPVPPPAPPAPAAAPPAAAPQQPYAQPAYVQPPAYGQPAYGQQGQPAYGQPAYGQPAYGQPAYGQPYAQPYPVGPRTNVLSIIALVLSLVGIFTGITAVGGVICGHIALSQIKRTGENGRGLALGGVITGYIVVGLWILFVVGYIVVLLVVFGSLAATSAYSSTY